MRLKFVNGDGHRSVDVVEYNFIPGSPPSVTYTRKDGHVNSEVVTTDVYVTSDQGHTIDKLSKQTHRKG